MDLLRLLRVHSLAFREVALKYVSDGKRDDEVNEVTVRCPKDIRANSYLVETIFSENIEDCRCLLGINLWVRCAPRFTRHRQPSDLGMYTANKNVA